MWLCVLMVKVLITVRLSTFRQSSALFLNDYDTVQEVPEESLDINSAYILFYERRNIDLCTFLPDLTNTVLDISEIEDDIESKYKRFCVVQ